MQNFPTLTFTKNMKTLCLILLFHASLQLQCDKKEITAHIGGEFLLFCKYDTNSFLHNKKYWCRGASSSTCTILAHSEKVVQTRSRSHIIDGRRRGLIVKVTGLQFDDAGAYWVGIDKIYADIMTSVKLVVTEVPVSKPRLWPLTSLVDGPTCWGEPVTVHCECAQGSGVRYTWHRRTRLEDSLPHPSSELYLNCGSVGQGSDYYCVAANDVSSQESELLSVQVLRPANRSCIYVVTMPGQPIYDCADRMCTTVAKTPPLTTNGKIHNDTGNRVLQMNHTCLDQLLKRVQICAALWMTLLRWSSLVFLLIFLCIVFKCTKTRHRKRPKRKRAVHFKQVPH